MPLQVAIAVCLQGTVNTYIELSASDVAEQLTAIQREIKDLAGGGLANDH